MSTFPAAQATSLEYRDAVRRGDVDPVDGVREYVARLQHVDRQIGAVLEWTTESALADAAAVARRRAGGETRPLDGVPFTVKGNIATRVGTTTAASRVLAGHRSPYEATAVARLRAAGAILVGKTNLDEFGMGASCEHSAVQATRNPWQRDRVPGGSSGGAAAAAAVHGWGFHLGSDTGGSIRLPAAFCGVTGLKPTYGTVSRYGLLAFASSLDQIGPITRSIVDAAAVLQVIAGPDPRDATTRPIADQPPRPRRRCRIGLPREFLGEGIDAGVVTAVRRAAAQLEEDGHELVDVSLPHTRLANACYQVIATAEASSNLARYDGVHCGQRAAASDIGMLYRDSRGLLGDEVRRRVLLGTFVLSAGYHERYYRRALQVRRQIRADFQAAFTDVDVLLGPTSPVPPFRHGERVTDPLALYACDVLTVSANLAGIPALSIPGGFDDDGLPIGLQLHAAPGDEDALIGVAGRYQQCTDHHRQLAAASPHGAGGGGHDG